MTDMMQTLAAAGSQNPNALIEALVASGHISAERRQILEMVMAQNTVADHEPDTDPDYDPDPEPYKQIEIAPEPGVDEENARALLLCSADRIDQLEELTEKLGRALGACPECFGTDPDCADCDGNGVPGHRLPARSEFSTFVIPALSRMKRNHPTQVAQSQSDPLKGSETITLKGETDHGT